MEYIANDSKRLDVFMSEVAEISRSQAKNILEDGLVTVNGKLKTKSGYDLKPGDKVEFEVPVAKPLDYVEPKDIPLDIVFQDKYFAVINKPKGMVVHPASSYRTPDTLVNALLFNLDNLSGINGVIRPGIVHRLDKDTSGLLVVAKCDEAHKNLASQIEHKTAQRIYYGLCDGNFKEDEGTVDAPIGRNKKDRKKMGIVEGGRHAVTHYKVIERFGKYTLVRFQLETGRTHQIRVHASSIHHPIVGDEVYGGSTNIFKNGQLLHAKELNIKHPITGEDMHFETELPDFFNEVLEKLRKQM